VSECGVCLAVKVARVSSREPYVRSWSMYVVRTEIASLIRTNVTDASSAATTSV